MGIATVPNGITLNNTGTVDVQTGTLVVGPSFTNFSGTTLTGGTFQVSGTGIFKFTNADIVTNAATIVLDGASSQIVDASDVDAFTNFATNGASGSFTIQNGRNLPTAGAFGNAGSITIGTGSTFTVGGGANYTQTGGSTAVNGGLTTATADIQTGTLSGSGTVTGNASNAGTVGPGASAGSLTITGNYTQTSAGTLAIEIGGLSTGTQYDQLNVTGAVTLDGTLDVTLINSFTPVAGNTFRILTFGSKSGAFAASNGLDLGSGLELTKTFGATELDLVTHGISEATLAAGLAGASTAAPNDEVQIFAIGLTGDGVSTVSSISLTLSDLSGATGLVTGDFSELRLYRSTDVILDGGDTQIGAQVSVNVGSATVVNATTPDVPANGTEIFYIISAVLSTGANPGHAFRVAFNTGGVSTSLGTRGTSFGASDANSVTIGLISESTTATGLTGTSSAAPGFEVSIFSIGLTGDGASTLSSITMTLSDLTAPTGLVAGDFDELRLYRSSDVTLDGSDTQIGSQATVNVGSSTTISATSAEVLPNGETFYLVSVIISATPGAGHGFRVGFASGGVSTSLGGIGTSVAASDANSVTLGALTETTLAQGLIGINTIVSGGEVRIFSIGITGNGFSDISAITATVSDLSTPTGLDTDDFEELRLYRSEHGALDGTAVLLGTQTSIAIGAPTAITAGAAHVPDDGQEVFYLVSAVVSSTPGHAFRVGFSGGGVTTSAGGIGTAVAASNGNRVTISSSVDPPGVRVRVDEPSAGAYAAIGDSVRVSVLAYRVLAALDTVVVGLSSSTALSDFGDLGFVDTLLAPTATGSSVDTFSVAFAVAPGDTETVNTGALVQALVSVENDVVGLKPLDNQSTLPITIGFSSLGLVGDGIRFGIDGRRPLNTFFDSVLVDTAALVNTGGDIFGTRSTSDAPGGVQRVRSIKRGDLVGVNLAVNGASQSVAIRAIVTLVDAVDPALQDAEHAYYTIDYNFVDLVLGQSTKTFTTIPGDISPFPGVTQNIPEADNLRVKAVAYLVDEAGNLSANAVDAADPAGFEQDIQLVLDLRAPAVTIDHPAASGDRFTGRIDTTFAFVDSTGSLDPAAVFTLDPLRFSVDEATSSRTVTVAGQTVQYGGSSDTDVLSFTTTDAFSESIGQTQGGSLTLNVSVVDSVGNIGSARIEDVIQDQVAPTVSDLSPVAAELDSGVINALTRHPGFTVDEPLDSVSVRYVRHDTTDPDLVSQTLVPTSDERTFAVTVDDELVEQTTYTLQILVRDLAGNLALTAPDTFTYRESFQYPLADSFLVTLDSAQTSVDSVLTGVGLPIVITAIDTSLTFASDSPRAAVTYAGDIVVTAVAEDQDLSGIRFEGPGVEDRGNGTAALDAAGWSFGSRILTVRSTKVLDAFTVVVEGPHGDEEAAESPITGRVGPLTVVPPNSAASPSPYTKMANRLATWPAFFRSRSHPRIDTAIPAVRCSSARPTSPTPIRSPHRPTCWIPASRRATPSRTFGSKSVLTPATFGFPPDLSESTTPDRVLRPPPPAATEGTCSSPSAPGTARPTARVPHPPSSWPTAPARLCPTARKGRDLRRPTRSHPTRSSSPITSEPPGSATRAGLSPSPSPCPTDMNACRTIAFTAR